MVSVVTAVVVELAMAQSGLGTVVVSEGRSLVDWAPTGRLVVTTKAEQFLRSVPLLVSTR